MNQPPMKQYLLSVQLVDDGTPPASPEEMQPMYQAVDAFNARLQAAGAWVFAGGLHPPASATVVRVKDGETLITDGPYVETKEALDGYFTLEAADLDAAIEVAKRVPALQAGGAVEIRPIMEWGGS